MHADKIEIAKTVAHNVYVSWGTRPDGRAAAYLKPMKDHFDMHDEDQGLINKWKITGFMARRCYNEDDPLKNKKLPGSPEASWYWDGFVSIAKSDEDTVASIGKHIASTFANFTDECRVFNKKVQYTFRR